MKINEMAALLSGEARTAAAHADADINLSLIHISEPTRPY